jgi:hypothetical protein
MHSYDIRGVATSNFYCSAGVCSGIGYTTQLLFMDLQKQVNRLGLQFGITKLDPDGRLGPATLRSINSLVLSLSQRLGSNLDRALEDLLIGQGDPDLQTTTKDLALNADTIVAALKRDGVAETPWSVLTAVKDFATQIIETGGAAADATVPPPATVVNPTAISVVTPSSLPPAGQWSALPGNATVPAMTAPPVATSAASALPVKQLPHVPTWMIAAGVGLVVVVGGAAAALSSRKKPGVSGTRRRQLGCACAGR